MASTLRDIARRNVCVPATLAALATLAVAWAPEPVTDSTPDREGAQPNMPLLEV